MSSRPSRGAARLAAILDALPDALVLVNANGTVVNANTIALEAFETPGTALVGRGLLDLLPEFDSKLIPGSMRRPDHIDPRGRTKPARMIARRTDGVEFPVEVSSATLENGQQAYDGYGYAPDELLMLVVRDLSGTVDTEAELARSQRQTEMILRAASEGVVGTDTDGRIVLVNPAAAQILGYRASDLGGKELHTLVLHSRPDGAPFPYDESPLADTLRSGRKHRVRGQVLFAKNGDKVSVDLTTAPVRDGDQLVGAVMTFTDRRPYDALAKEKEDAEEAHAEELERLAEEHASDLTALRQRHVTEIEELTEQHAEETAAADDRYAALGEREKDRYEALAGRHDQLLTLLGRSLRGPLDELRRELATLAADDAGQLWPEANQVLHHLSAGYSRITTLIDNVLGYQLLDTGEAQVSRTKVMLDAVVAAGVDGAVELIGPGRVQFAVHAPPIEAEVDARLLATALAHLVADVAGVDATGNAPVSASGYMDNTVVVAAAQRGEVVRIEVRGPYSGGDPVHEPIVRGIVRAHGGVLQTVEVPGMSGSAYVLEVPLGGGAGVVPTQEIAVAQPAAQEAPAEEPRRPRRSSVDAFLEGDDGEGPVPPTGRRRRRGPAAEEDEVAVEAGGGSGRRRGRPAIGGDEPAEGAVVTAAEHAAGTAAAGAGLGAVPPQGVPVPPGGVPVPVGGVGAAGTAGAFGEQNALPPALPSGAGGDEQGEPTGRRRRALAAAGEKAAAQEAGPRAVFALPPAEADRGVEGQGAGVAPVPAQGVGPGQGGVPVPGVVAGQGAVPGQAVAPVQGVVPGQAGVPGQGVVPAQGPVPPQMPVPAQGVVAPQAPVPVQGALPAQAPVPAQGPTQGPAGVVPPQAVVPPQGVPVPPQPQPQPVVPGQLPAQAGAGDHPRHDAVPHDQADDHTPPQPHPASAPTGRRRRAVAVPPGAEADEVSAEVAAQLPAQAVQSPGVPAQAQPHPAPGQTGQIPLPPQPGHTGHIPLPLPAEVPAPQPLPAETMDPKVDPNSTQGRAISVRTLGQGVPFTRQAAQVQQPSATPPGGTPSAGRRRKLGTPPGPEARPHPPAEQPIVPAQSLPHPSMAGQTRLAPGTDGAGRSYAIGAPDSNAAEGPEPLDGPGGAVEVADPPRPQPMDDELPPEPLDNPRRLLVWPAPDVTTQQALSDRGYRPVIVNSREEVDAQIAAFPAALFVDPLTGPITRTALQSLRTAAVAADVPVLVTAGLGQATREAAYGADPAVLLKALAPRDSEQHPPRVLLIEEHAEIALALTSTLERRGMQVARAASDADAVMLAGQFRPNLVVMDLMQVDRRQAGILDWLRANGQLTRTPLVVYTAAVEQPDLPRLASGETVLFLAERSTSGEVQSRIVDLLARIGTN